MTASLRLQFANSLCLAGPARGPGEARSGPGRGPVGARTGPGVKTRKLHTYQKIRNKSQILFLSAFIKVLCFYTGPRPGPVPGPVWAMVGPRAGHANAKVIGRRLPGTSDSIRWIADVPATTN